MKTFLTLVVLATMAATAFAAKPYTSYKPPTSVKVPKFDIQLTYRQRVELTKSKDPYARAFMNYYSAKRARFYRGK